MRLLPLPVRSNALVRACALLVWLMFPWLAYADPTIVSTVPTSGATGVPLSATLTITFSEPMDSSATTAYLLDSTSYEVLPSSLAWSAGNSVLTCTPNAALPANRTIWWTVANGQNPSGVPLSGYTGGTFTTATGAQLTLTNAVWSGGVFAFDVASPGDQTFTVEYSSALAPGQWQTLLTTNNAPSLVHVVDPHSSTNRSLFYRARTGS